MILNGAQQGVAGFGLATEPNHQALIYDPSQPLHSPGALIRLQLLYTRLKLWMEEYILMT